MVLSKIIKCQQLRQFELYKQQNHKFGS